MMRQPPFAEDLENRLLHRLVLRLADVDPPLSLRVQRQDLLFHAAQGEDESYLDKSSCASGGPTLDNPFSSPSAIVAGEDRAGVFPSSPPVRKALRPRPWPCQGRGAPRAVTSPRGARGGGRARRALCVWR